MKKIIIVALFGATLLYAEISAFGVEDTTQNSSYSLSSNEKLFRDKFNNLNNENIQINAKISEISERVEGLQSTLEGINSQYTKSNSKLTQLGGDIENIENNFTAEIQKLKVYVEESRKIQETNSKQIKKVLSELSSLVDAINANYVSKHELNDLNLSLNVVQSNIKDTNATVKNGINVEKQEIKEIDDSWKKKKNNEILELAIKDLDKNAFYESKVKLDFLITKQYKPARANFLLGEIEYKKKNYSNAIVYYKKSFSIDKRGDYFPKLLYHTAISLDKIGDTKTANGFYKALKTSYPDTPEAKASPNRK